jgi:hypothetical protein
VVEAAEVGRVGDLGPHLAPPAQHALLEQAEGVDGLDRHGVQDAEQAHAHEHRGEHVVVLLDPVLGVGGAVGERVGDPALRLDPVDDAARGDEVDRARERGERAVRDARAVRRGRHHAGERLAVVAAHVREREAAGVEQLVELADARAGPDPQQPRGVDAVAHVVELQRAGVAFRAQHVAAAERDVRPRVSRADGAHRRAVGAGAPDELDQVGELRRVEDRQRVDGLRARDVAHRAAVEGAVQQRLADGLQRHAATWLAAWCETAITVAWQFAQMFVGKTLASATNRFS